MSNEQHGDTAVRNIPPVDKRIPHIGDRMRSRANPSQEVVLREKGALGYWLGSPANEETVKRYGGAGVAVVLKVGAWDYVE